jgi:hypothetical protein
MAAPGEFVAPPAAAPAFDAFQTAMLAESRRQSTFAKMAAIEAIHAGNATPTFFYEGTPNQNGGRPTPGSYEFRGQYVLFIFPPAMHSDEPPPLASTPGILKLSDAVSWRAIAAYYGVVVAETTFTDAGGFNYTPFYGPHTAGRGSWLEQNIQRYSRQVPARAQDIHGIYREALFPILRM